MQQYRRRRELKTNYAKRFTLLKSGKNRIVIRVSNLYINVQYVEHNTKGDNIKLSVMSKELKKFGWLKGFKSVPASYLTGYLFGKKALNKKLNKDVIVDFGLHKVFKKGRLFAVVKGLIDQGLKVPTDPKVFLSNERITGKHNKTDKLFAEVKAKIDSKFKQ